MPDGPADQRLRDRACDPSGSFIVQAPAGSGKTELLIQRYLGLLAHVQAPEEIVAITFTRKAAGEMRRRVLDALAAAHGPEPATTHERITWRLARAALARDEACAWAIQAHPARLRIQTIDSLCMALTRQMPWLSGFGGVPGVTEDAQPLYRAAAEATAQLIEAGGAWGAAVADVLEHLDNDVPRLVRMLADMLARRDQWLDKLGRAHQAEDPRAALEGALARAIEETLASLRRSVPGPLAGDIVALAGYAGDNLRAEASASVIAFCAGLVALPQASVSALACWRGLAELLLTASGAWRTRFTARQGLPADKGESAQAMKARAEHLRASLSGEERLRTLLGRVRALPEGCYTDRQWEALRALVALLPLAAAQLRVVFAEHGQVDFVEVAQGAVAALGEPDAPTDLALALDYRIQHILLDEFQDTSLSQFALLERLTAGWTPGDGRTLFLVGDPMQSIYRFREADVGLYLRARRDGIGSMPLEPLTLRVNFRSQAGIVDWINATFPGVMPAAEEIGSGAVPYSECVAYHPRANGPAVHVHPFAGTGWQAEARQVARIVRQARDDGTTAILVRSRSHLRAILPYLKAEGLRFTAVDLEPLAARPVVQDLLALTRAMVHPADRVAWLAALRAPWCGLTLSDLHRLVAQAGATTLMQLLADAARLAQLSAPGRERARRVQQVLARAWALRGRRSLRRRVEGAWLALGGPACVGKMDLADAAVYLDLIGASEQGADLPDIALIEQRVAALTARPDVVSSGAGQLEIMSMHKAKGLEFDTVILPGLGRSPRGEDAPILAWAHSAAGPHARDVLLAPMHATGEERDAIYEFLRELEKEKGGYEAARLLYVAATRARKKLHLLGNASLAPTRDTLKRPDGRSLLALLWPTLTRSFERALLTDRAALEEETPAGGKAGADVELRRLPLDWERQPPPAPVRWQEEQPSLAPAQAEQVVEFSWVGASARHVGTVVHRYLRRMARDGLDHWSRARVRELVPAFRAALLSLGVSRPELGEAADRVAAALSAVLDDPRARWILDPGHPEADSEYALSGMLDGRLVNAVLDRTFVGRDGIRWVIDYKTSAHGGGDLEAFLDREVERYRVQLERYAGLAQRLDDRPVRLGLYFPLLRAWREWSPGVNAPAR